MTKTDLLIRDDVRNQDNKRQIINAKIVNFLKIAVIMRAQIRAEIIEAQRIVIKDGYIKKSTINDDIDDA